MAKKLTETNVFPCPKNVKVVGRRKGGTESSSVSATLVSPADDPYGNNVAATCIQSTQLTCKILIIVCITIFKLLV